MNSILTIAQARTALEQDLQAIGDRAVQFKERWFLYIQAITGIPVLAVCGAVIWESARKPFIALAIGALAVRLGCAVISSIAKGVLGISHYRLLYKLEWHRSDAPLREKLLREVAGVYSKNAQIALLAKMDLDQASEARRVMGKQKFRRLIASREEPQLQLWKSIDEITAMTTKEEIESSLNTLAKHRRTTWFEPVVIHIEKELQGSSVYESVRPRLWELVPALNRVTIRFEHDKFSPLVITRKAAQEIEGPLLTLGLGQSPVIESDRKDLRTNKVYSAPKREVPREMCVCADFCDTEERYQTLRRVLARLNQERVPLEFETWFQDLRFADQFVGGKGVAVVEKDLSELEIPNTLETYRRLGAFYCNAPDSPHKKKLMDTLQALFLRTRPTEQERKEFESEFGFPSLEQEGVAILIRYYKRIKDPSLWPNLYNYNDACEEEQFISLLDEVPLTERHLKEVHAFFADKRDPKGQAALQKCIDLGRSLRVQDQVKIWGPFGIPREMRSV